MIDAILNTAFVLLVLVVVEYVASALASFFYSDVVVVVSVPQDLKVLLKGEFMADLLTYQVAVAAPISADVVSRVLTVTVDGVVQPAVTFGGRVMDLGNAQFPQDSQVVLSLVDVDDAGNKSEPTTVEFTALDTLAPAPPGAFAVFLVAEARVADAPVVEAPVAETPVVEAPVAETPVVDESATDVTNG